MLAKPILLTLVATAALLALAFQPAHAQHYVALETPNSLGSCYIIPATGLVEVAVVHYARVAGGASAIQFAAPIPSCLGGGAVWLADQFSGRLVFGNTQTGVIVSYGACLGGPIVVGSILLSVPAMPDPCCHMPAVPHPASTSGMIEAVDCAGQVVPLVSGPGGVFNSGGTTCATMDSSHTPQPANAATDVALNTQLSWIPGETRNPCGLLAYPYGVLSMGTDPDSLEAIGWDMPNPFDPGILEQATTYYWQVVYSFGEDGATSPVWEFTTTPAPLPVEATTWGRLKALYE